MTRGERRPDIVVEGGRTDAATLDRDADRVASGLLAAGLAPGDRVAVLTPARVASLQAWFGIARAGMVEVPLNPASGATALAWCLSRSRARAVVCAPELLPQLRTALPESAVELVLLLPAEGHVGAGPQ